MSVLLVYNWTVILYVSAVSLCGGVFHSDRVRPTLPWSPSVHEMIVTSLSARARAAINPLDLIFFICISDYVSLLHPYVPPVLIA